MKAINKISTYLPINFLFLTLAVLLSCNQKKTQCNLSEATLNHLRLLDSLYSEPSIRTRDSIWNQDNYQEPPVVSSKHETYRLILGTSSQGSEIYKIENIEGLYKATVKTFTYGNSTPNIKEFLISESKWNAIKNNLATIGFWTYSGTDQVTGLDGQLWKLEGIKKQKDECSQKHYQRIDSWYPKDKALIDMCNLLKTIQPN